MVRNTVNPPKENDEQEHNDFLKSNFCFGLVTISDVATIEKIKKYVAKQPNVKIIYQRLSTNKLWIVEKERNQGGE